MTVVGSSMPPEIWEVTQEAGAANVFWWSNRWRPGRKPGVGQASGQMTNAIPGSPIETTQGVTSAQPISANRGYSFEGDDDLVGTQKEAGASLTIAGALIDRSPQSLKTNLSYQKGGAPHVGIVTNNGNIFQVAEDTTGTTDSNAQTAPAAGEPYAFALTFSNLDTSSIGSRLTIRAPGISATYRTTLSLSEPISPLSGSLRLGSGQGFSNFDGIFMEIGAFLGVAPDRSRLARIADALALRHGIPLS